MTAGVIILQALVTLSGVIGLEAKLGQWSWLASIEEGEVGPAAPGWRHLSQLRAHSASSSSASAD